MKPDVSRPCGNRFGLPNLGIGVGLRSTHYQALLSSSPAVDWLEIISENYMDTQGRPRWVLSQLAERYPLVMHGVACSIGSTDPLNLAYMRSLKALRDELKIPWVSDHLCWTGVLGRNSHDLLPMPLTDASLAHVVARVRQAQDILEAPFVLENPSTYVAFANDTWTEWDFLSELCKQAGCGLLLDVNNIYVSSRNHGFDPQAYLAAVPWDHVIQMHIAGHTDNGNHCIDTHIGPVPDPVWKLAAQAYQASAGVSVLLEWDAEIPAFDVVHREALRLHEFLKPAGNEVLA